MKKRRVEMKSTSPGPELTPFLTMMRVDQNSVRTKDLNREMMREKEQLKPLHKTHKKRHD
jgi:hypothetical protein